MYRSYTKIYTGFTGGLDRGYVVIDRGYNREITSWPVVMG